MCCDQWACESTHAWRPGSGRGRQTTRREDRLIARQARTTPTASSSSIHAAVAGALRNRVSTRTISRRLVEGGLVSRRPLRVLPLTATHRRLLLQWCRERQSWTFGDWQRIVFSDESRFCLGAHDGRVRVRRRLGERLNPAYSVERHTAPIPGVMVWARDGSTRFNKPS